MRTRGRICKVFARVYIQRAPISRHSDRDLRHHDTHVSSRVEDRKFCLKKNTLAVAVQSGESNGAQGITSGTNEEKSSKMKSLCKCLASCKKDPQQPASRSNKTQSQSKVIFYRALAHAMAWFGAWLIYVVTFVWKIVPGSDVPRPLYTLQGFLNPLQGLFNFCIYMYPKVMKAKRSKKDNLTWWQACIRSLTSRGNKRKMGAPLRSLSSKGRQRRKWSLPSFRSSGNETMRMLTPLSGSSGASQLIQERRLSKKTQSQMIEEEKCEQEPGERIQQKMFKLLETAVKNEQPLNFPIKLDIEKEQEGARRNGEIPSDTMEAEKANDNQAVEEMEDMES